MKAYVNYPNLQFSDKVIDFACILHNTAHIREITVYNNERLTVQYHWYIRKTNETEKQEERCEKAEKFNKNEKCDEKPEINETFKKIEKRFNETNKLNEVRTLKVQKFRTE